MRALSLSRSWKLGWNLSQPSFQCRDVAARARKQRIAFLGTPQVATIPLKGLLEAARKDENSEFEVVAVVSQPPRARGRGKKPPQPSPVHQAALEANIPESAILTPVKATEVRSMGLSLLYEHERRSIEGMATKQVFGIEQEEFISTLATLEPDLCVTAAYGNMLPQKLLDMPKFGTLNIHPSLLPKYRGAAPVNRCLENGDAVTGVSVAYTVLKCDAGPVLAQQELKLLGNEQAPELLDTLFTLGTDLLIEKLPEVWSGTAQAAAVAQDETCMTHAAKMAKQDGLLDFEQPAQCLHNKVRGFAGWPGTWVKISIVAEGRDAVHQDLKILETKLLSQEDSKALAAAGSLAADSNKKNKTEICVCSEGLLLPCGDGNVLLATCVQAPGKKACSAAAFGNGHNGKSLYLEAVA